MGNIVKEKILLILLTRREAHARDISSVCSMHLLSVQNQLKKLERGGVLCSSMKGRTRLYEFNPRYPFIKELNNLLKKALLFIPKEEKERYYSARMRPRRAGKPI